MAERKPAAISIDWPLATRSDPSALDKTPAFALGAEPEILEKQDRVDREGIVELQLIDLWRRKPGHREGARTRFLRRGRGDVRHRGNLPVPCRVRAAEEIGGRLARVAGAVGCDHDDGAGTIGDQAAIADRQRIA